MYVLTDKIIKTPLKEKSDSGKEPFEIIEPYEMVSKKKVGNSTKLTILNIQRLNRNTIDKNVTCR